MKHLKIYSEEVTDSKKTAKKNMRQEERSVCVTWEGGRGSLGERGVGGRVRRDESNWRKHMLASC